MTTIENQSRILSKATTGIYLLGMTTIENDYVGLSVCKFGIDLLEMTTIENNGFNHFKTNFGYLPA